MVDSFGGITPDPLRHQAIPESDSLERQAKYLRKNGDDAAIRQFSQDFEALFVQRLMKEMRKSVPHSELMGNSMSMQWFEEMFDQAVAKEVAAENSIGMAQVIYEQLTRSAGEGHSSGMGAVPPARAAGSAPDGMEQAPAAETEKRTENGGIHE